jgi:hypothetical protein
MPWKTPRSGAEQGPGIAKRFPDWMQHLSSFSLTPCQFGLRHHETAAIAASCIPPARQIDPMASTTGDQPASGISPGAERRFAGGGSFREAGPEKI